MATTIHGFAEQGDKEGVMTQIKAGVDVNGPDSSNRSPLHYAAINGHAEIVAVLLTNGASVNCQTNRGATPLHYSARSGRIACMSLLLENGGDVNCRDSSGNTPLHAAISCHETSTALALIQNYGADVHIQNNDGQSPLHLACSYGFRDVIMQLLEKGAKTNVRDIKGDTPLSIISLSEIDPIKEPKVMNMGNDIASLMCQVKKSEQNGMDIDSDNSTENNQGLFSDVVLVVEGHQVPAHRAILAARCPHFRSLFKKSSSAELEITDVKFDLFIALLEWIYKDTVSSTTKPDQIDLSFVYSLMTLAERYQIKSLVSTCEHYMANNLSTTSLASVWPEIKKASSQLKQSFPTLISSCAQLIAKSWNVISVTKIGEEMSKNDIISMLTVLPIAVAPEGNAAPAAAKPKPGAAPRTGRASTGGNQATTTPAKASGGSAPSSTKKAAPAPAPAAAPVETPASPPTTDVMDKKNLEICKGLTVAMFKRKNSDIFHIPVDPVAEGIPTYFEIIKSPMDLSTVQKKLNANSYKTIKEYASDVRLMFYNSLTFNLENTPVWRLAKSLLNFFNQKYGAAFPFETIPEIPVFHIPPPAAAATAQSAVAATPEKKRKSAPSSTTATSTSNSNNTTNINNNTNTSNSNNNNNESKQNVEQNNGSKKKYTDDERRILMEKINELNEQQLQTILDIIEPRAIKQNDDGVEIDMYEVSDGNLAQLEDFINTCLKKKKVE